MTAAPDHHAASETPPAAPRPRVWAAALYEVGGDLRFLSHHDEMRMITRALIRSRWPIAYSEGFNPQPRLSVAVPRRLGTASAAQLVVVELTDEVPPSDLAARLRSHLPAGCRLRGAFCPLSKRAMHAAVAEFRVPLAGLDIAGMEARVSGLLERSDLKVERRGAPDDPVRRIDIRPFIEELVIDDRTLRMRLTFNGQQSARPIEIVSELGLPTGELEHRVELTDITWTTPLPEGCAAWHEREDLGQEEDHHSRADEPRA